MSKEVHAIKRIEYTGIEPYYFSKIKITDELGNRKNAVIYLTKKSPASANNTSVAYIGERICTTKLCTVYNLYESERITADNSIGCIVTYTTHKIDVKGSYAIVYAAANTAIPNDLSLEFKSQFMSIYTSNKVDFLISCKMSSAMEFILEEQ